MFHHLKLDQIHEAPDSLRDVDTDSVAFLELVDSVRTKGVLQPILVCPSERGEDQYVLIAGRHRYTAARKLGLETIPAYVKALGGSTIIELQITENLHKIETKPVEYSRALYKWLCATDMTVRQLSRKINKSEAWVHMTLRLGRLEKNVAKIVDGGQIPVTSAYLLAKLPPEEQKTMVESAIALPQSEFAPICNQRVRDLRSERRGRPRENAPAEFMPVMYLRKLSELKDEIERPIALKRIAECDGLSTQEKVVAAVKWVLHYDHDSVAAQRDVWDSRQRENALRKEARRKEREEMRAEERRRREEEAAQIKAEIESGNK